MQQRHKTVTSITKAAVYQVLRKQHQQRRRWLIGFESVGIAIVVALSLVLQTYFEIKPPTYTLDQSVYNLIGESRDDTVQYLKDDTQAQAFSFSIPKVEESETSVHTGRKADAYEASLPKDAQEGINFTDTTTNISIGLAPKFKTYQGRKVEGDHIVYLMSGGSKIIYTLKYNGLKEDIIVSEFKGNELSYDFEMKLPSGVEARLDERGNIGIYSSDPTLYGNISFGSDDDRARVDKARENGEKTNLVATIPYPIVKDSTGTEYTDKAVFELGEKQTRQAEETNTNQDLPAEVREQMKTKTSQNVYTLSIQAKELQDLSYPISIDPTIQSTSAGDFGQGNFDNTELDPEDSTRIQRAGLTGGTISRDVFSDLQETRYAHATIAINGWFYLGGGVETSGGGGSNEFWRTPINESDGTVGTYQSLTNLPVGGGSQFLYANGYLYYYAAFTSTFYYAPLSASGVPGAWTDTTDCCSNARTSVGFTLVKNRIYAIGGWSGSADSRVTYFDILGNGSLGSEIDSAGNYLPSGRYGQQPVYYNNYIYWVSGGTTDQTIAYARVASDGSLSWQTSGNLVVQGRYSPQVFALKGYLYIMGGYIPDGGDLGSAQDMAGTVEYAQINADGSPGQFRTISGQSWTAGNAAVAQYKDFLYTSGGCTNNLNLGMNCGSAATIISAIGIFRPKPAGWAETWTTQTNQYASGRQNFAAVAYNGYLYVAGGCYSDCYGSNQGETDQVEYAPINADGSLGTWAASTFPNGRAGVAMTAYNGYLYVSGGFSINLGTHTNYTSMYYAAVNASTGVPGAWNLASAQNITRAEHSIIAYEGYIYSIGGRAGTTVLDLVWAAPLNMSTGNTSGNFAATTPLPNDNVRASAIFANGRFYVFGGCSALSTYTCTTGQHDEIYYATPGANGTVGSWTTQTDGFDGTKYDYGTVSFVNGYFYVHGGDGNGAINFVKYAILNSDGSVGPWTTTTSSLTRRADQETLAYGGYFYVIGGNASRTIDRIPINNGGSGRLSTWAVDAGGNPAARKLHSTVAYKGYLYVLGGCPSSSCLASGSATADVAYAPIEATGEVGSWNSTASFSLSRERLVAFAYNDRMYIMGGRRNSNTPVWQDDIQSGVIASNGTISGWTTAPGGTAHSDLPGGSAHYGMTAALYGNTIYVTGGTNAGATYDNVYMATIGNATGVVGAWTHISTRPEEVRYSWLAVAGGRLYSIGGVRNDSATLTKRVYSAQINSDGTLGSWEETTSMPYAASTNTDGKTHVLNGYMYLIYDVDRDIGGNYIPYTFRAPILPSGQLGQWEPTERPNYTGGPDYLNFNSAMYGGRLYVTGGHITSATCDPCARTTYTTIQSIPRVGSFSKLFDFGSGVKPTKLITRGSKRGGTTVALSYQNVNNTANSFSNSQSSSDISYAGANALNFALGTNVTLSRYLFLRYTIDETQSAVFPDTGNESTITDFDVYFTANPGQRLRGGRTFTGGSDRGLDAAPQ